MPRPPAHHYHPLVRSVARALRQRCRVLPGSAIVVGCSGGADSVALVRALAMLAERRKWRLRLIVGHVQHHLRDEAEDEAGFVKALAEAVGLPYARRDTYPGDMPGNLESNAREQRYRALSEIAAEHAAGFIATAHHADDQLETLIMRMLRGASVTGLRGIAWHQPLEAYDKAACELIRPMLGVERSAVAPLLDQLGQPYCEDLTNADTSRTRAKLRHDVIPLLKSLQPDSAGKAEDMAEHFRDLFALVQASADDATQSEDAGLGVIITRERARLLNSVVLHELLRRALHRAGVSADRLSRHALAPVVQAAQDRAGGTRRFSFANAARLQITREAVCLVTD